MHAHLHPEQLLWEHAHRAAEFQRHRSLARRPRPPSRWRRRLAAALRAAADALAPHADRHPHAA